MKSDWKTIIIHTDLGAEWTNDLQILGHAIKLLNIFTVVILTLYLILWFWFEGDLDYVTNVLNKTVICKYNVLLIY